MSVGSVTISIDLELAWGNWDNLEQRHIDHVDALERPIVKRLVETFDRHSLPVTWAFVAALLDRDSARERPGSERLWYAPDVIDTIRSARTAHDLGSHGGRHRYFTAMSEAAADEDLDFARGIHAANGLKFESFVFPRNQVARTALLERHGLRVFRGTDRAWHQRVRNANELAGRAANLVDKLLPIAPEPVHPERGGALVNLPGSMLLFGRDGIRRLAPPSVMPTKLKRGMARAAAGGGVFHLWFHPSNFWHDSERQFATLEAFAARCAERAGRGEITLRTMADFG